MKPLPIVAEDLHAWAQLVVPYVRGFLRALPSATLIPAFAIRGGPTSLRILIGLAIAAIVGPHFRADSGEFSHDLYVGISTALFFAMPLWCAAHIGAFADQVRGDPTSASQAAAVLTTPTGDLLVLAASLLWLSDGHWFVALRSLLHDDTHLAPPALLAAMLAILQSSLSLTLLVAVPMLAFEVAVLSLARLSAPIAVAHVVTPLRPLATIWFLLRAAPIVLGATR